VVRQVHTYVGRENILVYAMAMPIWLYKVEYSAFKESTCTCWGGEKKESFLFDPAEGETRVRLTSTVSITRRVKGTGKWRVLEKI
jgi:hypothetical protein